MVIRVHPHRDSDVRLKALINANEPSESAGCPVPTSGNDERRGEFVINCQEIGRRIATHGTALMANIDNGIRKDSWVHEAQLPVRFDELVVPIGSVPDQLVCSDQTAKALA